MPSCQPGPPPPPASAFHTALDAGCRIVPQPTQMWPTLRPQLRRRRFGRTLPPLRSRSTTTRQAAAAPAPADIAARLPSAAGRAGWPARAAGPCRLCGGGTRLPALPPRFHRSLRPAKPPRLSSLQLARLIHPDKCSHPQAKEAAQVLNQAWDTLNNAIKKRAYDAYGAARARMHAALRPTDRSPQAARPPHSGTHAGPRECRQSNGPARSVLSVCWRLLWGPLCPCP